MKKALSLIIALLIIMSSLSSCDRKYDAAEVEKAAAELIPLTAALNTIYWGKGLDYIDDTNTSNGSYYRASEVDLQKYGFETIDGLMEKTHKVFSDSYCESIFGSTIYTYSGEGGSYRYYQTYVDDIGGEPEYIMVYSKSLVLLFGEVEYLTDTIKATHSKKDTVYVTLSVRVTVDGKEPQLQELEVGLVEEDDGWRIDTPTYTNYVEEKEEK